MLFDEEQTVQETMDSLQKFLPPDKIGLILTGNSTQFLRVRVDLCWNRNKSSPFRSETNGIAENAVCRVKEGTTALLVQSSFTAKWWGEAMERFFYFPHIQDKLADTKSWYGRRFGSGKFCLSNLYAGQESLLPGIFHRIRFEFWRRLDRRL